MDAGATSICTEEVGEAASQVSTQKPSAARLCLGRKRKLQLFVRKGLDYVEDEEIKLEGAGLGSNVTPLKMLWKRGNVFISAASCYLVVKPQTKYGCASHADEFQRLMAGAGPFLRRHSDSYKSSLLVGNCMHPCVHACMLSTAS